jgi:ABC-type thiamine transport system ATPase subunit
LSRLELWRVAGRDLLPLDLVLDPGVTTLVVTSDAGGGELVAIASGAERPRRGTVRLHGKDPYCTPDQRRRIALLRDTEEALSGQTLEAAVSTILSIRGSVQSARAVLGENGLSAWATRCPATLSPAEHRCVAACLALAVENPLLCALVEPLAAGLDRRRVLKKLTRAAEAGAIVLCVVASMRDAADVGGRVLELTRERKKSSLQDRGAVGATSGLELVVRASPAAPLASALGTDESVFTVVYDQSRAPDEIVVRGPDLERSSLAVLRAAAASGVCVTTLEHRAIGSAAPRPPRQKGSP